MSNLIKWNPFFDQFEDMERLFNEAMPALRERKNNSFMPAVDMYEDDEGNVVIETQMAGIDPEKVDISIDNDVLTIKGEGEKKSEVEDKNYYKKEIRRGSFYRNIPLPASVDGDKASAITEEGLLKISVPKRSESKSKKIKIEHKDK